MRWMLVILVAVVSVRGNAQADAILDVQVYDSTGSGNVRNAEIRLLKNDTVVSSGARGWVRIRVKSGTETVIVTHPVLGADTQVVTLARYGNAELVVKLPHACGSFPVTDVCPHCHNNANVIDIIYGLPTQATMKRAQNGEVWLGGCMVDECMPLHYCKVHKLEF